MPWKERKTVDERMAFIARLNAGERMIDLCREYEISRKTGYKVRNRYLQSGCLGLVDQSRRPAHVPHRTPDDVRQLIVAVKRKHPTWGAKKLRAHLQLTEPGIRIPARSTIHSVLEREGLVAPRRRKRRAAPSTVPWPSAENPNDLWCVDFKGQFRLGNGSLCYPLTLTDHVTRYITCCEALANVSTEQARPVFEAVFRDFGLPRAILSDNGAPFASTGLGGLSRLSVWWMKLGITCVRIMPGHPEQNGRHERMHRTLKAETTRPAAYNELQQQERFDRFITQYNTERPHEAIEMMRPAELYEPSTRPYPESIPNPEYPLHDDVVQVSQCGKIRLPGFGRAQPGFFLSQSLAGERVGVREVDDALWIVSFVSTDLGRINLRTKRFESWV